MNALVPEVLGWLAARRIPLVGPPMYRYWVVGDADTEFRLDVAAPVAEPVDGDDRVRPGSVPVGRYVTAVHTGHPDRLASSLRTVEDWATGQGLTFDTWRTGSEVVWGARVEAFPTDPRVEPDRNRWSIEVAYRLADGAAS